VCEPQVCSSGVAPVNWPSESSINREKGAHPSGETSQDPAKRALTKVSGSGEMRARTLAPSGYASGGLPESTDSPHFFTQATPWPLKDSL
jgi:hypothetical protein